VLIGMMVHFGATLPTSAADLRLVEAMKNRDRAGVISLLQQRADVDAREDDGATALMWAAQWNDLEAAGLLIESGADANLANDYGITPISMACLNGSTPMVEMLLRARATPNASQWSGETPLMTCARTGPVSSVRALLAGGADVNAVTRRGQTALMWAAARRAPETVLILLKHGANPNATSHRLDGLSPRVHLSYAMHNHVPGAPNRFDADDVHEDPTSSRGGFTPLMFAARVGDIESARILLAHGADVNYASPEHGSALVMATASGQVAVAEILLQAGANPNLSDDYGLTALHYALREGLTVLGMSRPPAPTDTLWIRHNFPDLVLQLLAHGANPNAKVGRGFPAYDYPPFARVDANSANMPHLRQSGATPYLLAAAAGKIDLMHALQKAGATPLTTTNDGTTPLMVAAGLGRYEDFTEDTEKTALAVVQLLLDLGSDVNATNENGETALHGAAYRGANNIIQYLVSKGAILETKDKYGRTPLILAQGDPARLADSKDKRFRGTRAHKSSAELLIRLAVGAANSSMPAGIDEHFDH
jgi:uncharacterized protein